MRNAGRIAYVAAGIIQLAFVVVTVVMLFTSSWGDSLNGFADKAKSIIMIILFSLPTLISVVLGLKNKKEQFFWGAWIAIAIGVLSLAGGWFVAGPVAFYVSAAIAVTQICGGIIYLVAKK
ncbi:hypothetical protein SCHIN_v1c01330 [Spiroplasma chinense]|uniref:Uncharacterized protein n=1 Tax=Spiroplasma chinense TaxID=216932 RepID=A0A5B9Y2Z7_9MOLU|nr:hypothetical protein [Spiroplasma chinense]QEH61331.1 hypothetical protein SCHIN_v1c01330 [Spiroplasma chinense]